MRFDPSQHGLWLIEPHWANEAMRFLALTLSQPAAPVPDGDVEAATRRSTPAPAVQGTALIPVRGPLTKGVTLYTWLFGGTSTALVQAALNDAVADPDVERILLDIDSPGGHVAGIHALAQSVRQADRVKPVYAHIEDLGASAAYWVASQAREITASPTTEIGSIGTFAVVTDYSGAAEQQGLRVHVISTGQFKGAGMPGTSIDENTLADVERRVMAINRFFTRAVEQGRELQGEALTNVTDGRLWIASDARRLGLIDAVQSRDSSLATLATQGHLVSSRSRIRALAAHQAELERLQTA